MLQAQRLRFEPNVLVEHLSAQGPRVSGVRGIVVQSALAQLKRAGYWDDYIGRLPPAHHASLLESLASTWVPVEALVAHFQTLDAMPFKGAALARLSESSAAPLFESVFAGLLRAARTVGADTGMWTFLKQAERVWGRVYNGGGCKVIQVGPKDAIFEISGLLYASSPSFRTMFCGSIRGVMELTAAKGYLIKPVPSSEPRADRLTISISWV